MAPVNVGLCLDMVLRDSGLDYVDLWLAHWPFAEKPASREALERAVGGTTKSDEEQGLLVEDGKTVIGWEHTTARIAKSKGKDQAPMRIWRNATFPYC